MLAVVAAATVAYGLVRSLFMTGAKFKPPGPEITADEEPQLFEVIREVADKMGSEMPAAVYLMPDVNAFVAEVGGFFGFGARRVMGIGVGLMQVDTVQQLKATLAHELGHYAGGDTKLGGFLYRVRSSIVRVVHNLGGGVIASIFISYFRFFLRVTQKISRAQELAADEASVRVAGTEAHIQGLRREARGNILFQIFLRNDLAPLVDAGFRPKDLFTGFRKASKHLAKSGLKKQLDEALTNAETDEYDTHPALPERIAYAESLPTVEMTSDDRPARALLRDAAATERSGGDGMLQRSVEVGKLEAIGWKDVGRRVFGPQLEKEAARRREAQMAKAGYAAASLLEAAETAVSAMAEKSVAAWVERFEPKIATRSNPGEQSKAGSPPRRPRRRDVPRDGDGRARRDVGSRPGARSRGPRRRGGSPHLHVGHRRAHRRRCTGEAARAHPQFGSRLVRRLIRATRRLRRMTRRLRPVTRRLRPVARRLCPVTRRIRPVTRRLRPVTRRL